MSMPTHFLKPTHTVQTGPNAQKFVCDSGTVEFTGKRQ